jgi:hypothetical protein
MTSLSVSQVSCKVTIGSDLVTGISRRMCGPCEGYLFPGVFMHQLLPAEAIWFRPRLALRPASLLRRQFSRSSLAVLNVMSGIGQVLSGIGQRCDVDEFNVHWFVLLVNCEFRRIRHCEFVMGRRTG